MANIILDLLFYLFVVVPLFIFYFVFIFFSVVLVFLLKDAKIQTKIEK